nr:hypothetical protein [uncultured Acetatifactor sp.]
MDNNEKVRAENCQEQTTMVIGIFGESCTGKSTLADKLKESIHAQVYTGRNYLRLEKSKAAAKQSFPTKLLEAVNGENIIYVISEKEHLPSNTASASLLF